MNHYFTYHEYYTAYRKYYREEYNNYCRKWANKNRLQLNEWIKKHPEKVKQAYKKYRLSEKGKQRVIRFYQNHPEYDKIRWQKRKLRKKIFNTLNGVKIHGKKEKKVR